MCLTYIFFLIEINSNEFLIPAKSLEILESKLTVFPTQFQFKFKNFYYNFYLSNDVATAEQNQIYTNHPKNADQIVKYNFPFQLVSNFDLKKRNC